MSYLCWYIVQRHLMITQNFLIPEDIIDSIFQNIKADFPKQSSIISKKIKKR